MNPWSFYEHKPELLQAGVVAVAGLAWAAVGVLDYLTYAFGYQLAGLSVSDTDALHAPLEWIRFAIVFACAAFAFAKRASQKSATSRP